MVSYHLTPISQATYRPDFRLKASAPSLRIGLTSSLLVTMDASTIDKLPTVCVQTYDTPSNLSLCCRDAKFNVKVQPKLSEL